MQPERKPEVAPPPPSSTPNDLPDEVYAAIGRVSVMWGHFEQAVGVAISGLLDVPTASFFAISANMSAGAQLDSLLALGRLLPEGGPQTALAAIVNEARELAADRNKIIHGTWRSTQDQNVAVLLTARAKGKLRLEWSAISAEQLNELGDRIGLLKDELVAFLSAHGLME